MAKNDPVEEFKLDDEPVLPVVPPASDAEKKPYGQNVGDIVDANEARGGRYEAIGAGKMRRLED